MYNLLLRQRITYGSPPPAIANITADAQGWRRTLRAHGGCWLGSFTVSGVGREELIWWYNNHLGNHLEEQTFGMVSWEGVIYEMNLTLNGVRYRRTLDKEWFHNHVDVWYRDANVQNNAGWSENIDSSDEFGEMQYIDTIGEATAAGATALRDTRLGDYAYPRSRMIGGLEFGEEQGRQPDSLRVTAVGYISTMNWLYREASIAATAASTAITTLIGASEFITAGDIEVNTLSIDADCTTPQRLWDLIEDILLQGDVSGNRWVGGIYTNRRFDYKLAATTVRYFIRDGNFFNASGESPAPSLVRPDFIVHNSDAPMGGIPVGGNVWDDPRNAWITEVEFIAPNGLRLKPAGFEDVDILKAQDLTIFPEPIPPAPPPPSPPSPMPLPGPVRP